jgi:hypothetical protein
VKEDLRHAYRERRVDVNRHSWQSAFRQKRRKAYLLRALEGEQNERTAALCVAGEPPRARRAPGDRRVDSTLHTCSLDEARGLANFGIAQD